jgi:hypothetical protein
MATLNRSVVIVKPRRPYLEWTRADDAEGLAPSVYEAMRDEPQVYLLPEYLTDDFDGFLAGNRFLICDRDSCFTEQFRRILEDAGVEVIRTPRQAPNCNACAERFVLSIKSECLRRMIFLGESSLRHAVAEYVEHYHAERAPQGLGNERINTARAAVGVGEVRCRGRLGGILKSYHRAA